MDEVERQKLIIEWRKKFWWSMAAVVFIFICLFISVYFSWGGFIVFFLPFYVANLLAIGALNTLRKLGAKAWPR